MKLPAKLVCFWFIFFTCKCLSAQDKIPVRFGRISVQEFNLQSPLIDSGTSAVVVADWGKSEFIANASDHTFSLEFRQKRRIKIITKNGYDAATIVIPLYVGDNGKMEKLNDLSAVTYNVENGKVVQTKLDKASVFTEVVSKNWIHKKFTFPALREGSIIEYSIQVTSDFAFNLHPWNFQHTEYPVLWSQYEVAIPEFFDFVILSQGYHPFHVNQDIETRVGFTFIDRVEREGGKFTPTTSGINTYKLEGRVDYHTWVMKDVPPLKEEAYTTTIRNAIAKIEFQLKSIAFPRQRTEYYMNSWQKAGKQLLDDEQFGLPIKRANNWLDDEVTAVVKGALNNLQKAKLLYEYVRDHYSCTGSRGIYISNSLKEVARSKTGSVPEINMLLIAMLRRQQIAAEPVLLSTRSHGYTNDMYPLIDRFNYVIARVELEDGVYYLDATTPLLAFNRLPQQALNGHARVINEEAPPVYFYADSIWESNTTMVFVEPNEKAELVAAVMKQPGYYHSLEIRNQLAATGLDAFKKELQQQLLEDAEVDNLGIDSLGKLDDVLRVHYDLKIKAFGASDIVYFNPMLGESLKHNPFAAAVRTYPVEMPYAMDDIYSFNMKVPDQYVIDELPKSVRLMLNEDEGMFEYLVASSDATIQIRCRLQLKRATYTNEDYQSLRDFFALIVQKESEQIVFKKKKG